MGVSGEGRGEGRSSLSRAQGLPCTVSRFPEGQAQMHSLPSPAQGFSRWHLQDELAVEFSLKHHLVILSQFTERTVPGRHC